MLVRDQFFVDLTEYIYSGGELEPNAIADVVTETYMDIHKFWLDDEYQYLVENHATVN